MKPTLSLSIGRFEIIWTIVPPGEIMSIVISPDKGRRGSYKKVIKTVSPAIPVGTKLDLIVSIKKPQKTPKHSEIVRSSPRFGVVMCSWRYTCSLYLTSSLDPSQPSNGISNITSSLAGTALKWEGEGSEWIAMIDYTVIPCPVWQYEGDVCPWSYNTVPCCSGVPINGHNKTVISRVSLSLGGTMENTARYTLEIGLSYASYTHRI